MKDNNQLPTHTITINDHPEPHIMQWSDLELAAVKGYAEQYALQARAQVQGEPIGEVGTMPGTSGFTMACFRAGEVPVGTKIYTTPQPAQATQEEVTDSMIREAFLANGFTIKDGHSDLKPYVYAAARAILALRPERVPMTGEQRQSAFLSAPTSSGGHRTAFMLGIQFAEYHHGITAQAKKEKT